MELENERMHILEMIEAGRISADEGLQLLQALNSADQGAEELELREPFEPPIPPLKPEIPNPSPLVSGAFPSQDLIRGVAQPAMAHTGSADVKSSAAMPVDVQKWKRWWMVPLWIGVSITVFGGLFMYLAQQSSGVGWWFFCASVPFVLGLIVIVLAWQSRTSPWLHLHIQQPPGEKPERIRFSLPLPIGLGVWFINTFGRFIPGMQDQDWGQVIQAIAGKTSPDNPIYFQVDEDRSGEKVEIYIG